MALFLSAFGYTLGDVVMRLIGSPGICNMFLATSALGVGLVLEVDGAGVKSQLAHPGRIRQVGHFGCKALPLMKRLTPYEAVVLTVI